MPRFTARPVTVEAHQWGDAIVMLPDEFRVAVQSMPDGSAMVTTVEGAKQALHGDWIMRGPSGDYSVMRPGAFETMFEAAKRPYNRKELTNA